MRPTPKLSVCLPIVSLALLVFCNSGRPEEAEKAEPGIKELQQKRLAVLEQICDSAKHLFSQARIEFTEVLAARRELLSARLEYADTQEDRIKACDEAIEDARQWQKIAEARQKSARGTYVAVLKAQDFELEAQIARAKVETGK